MGFVLFADQGRPSKIERLADGSIRVMARISRDGIQAYAPWPEARIQGRPIKVYRPRAEVFADASLRTLKGTAVTVGHPPEREVTPATWKKYAVGHNEGEHRSVVGDDGQEYVETPIVVSDQETIDGVQGKDLVEISQGYAVDLKWEAGVTDSGEKYDAIQTNIRHNHTALLGVGQARAGQGARVLLDSSEEPAREKRKMDEKEKAEFAAQVVAATIDALDAREAKKAEEAKREAKIKADAKAEAEAELKAKQEAEGDKATDKGDKATDKGDEPKTEAEKAKAEAEKLLADKSDDAEKKAFADACDVAKPMLPPDYEFEGKTAREVHCDALERHLPAYKTEGKSDEQIAGAFEALKSSETKYVADSDPSRGNGSGTPDHVKEYNERMESTFADAWEKK